ncbi:EVE domain-containing protein [Methylobacterium sp. NEAU K]|uniref:HNH endonuclease n=1 Tax=Methylobacterium sp. NEAU K TaxID=3064946 RepID=UPI002736A9C5|nr:EVE domain-containing protein [Methylobacterium sp. NEAU K]MDP4006710.1 EVE domain-containing protein [Methylobacterium sp. NEAU K]
MAARAAGERRYWTLVADPNEYRITEAIFRLSADWWTSGRSDIRVGDCIAIWKTRGGKGGGRGIIALGEVVEGPVLRADTDNPFHLNPSRARDVMSRVAVSYIPLPHPLWDDGEYGAMISSLNAARARGGTVFTLSPEQWRALKAAGLERDDADDDEKLFSVVERKRYREHRRIERASTAAAEVKRVRGFTCEACGFAFGDMYGDLGSEFIEAHHLHPLASLSEGEEIRFGINDFAVLCSNCHRMIHRWHDPSDLEGFAQALTRRWQAR